MIDAILGPLSTLWNLALLLVGFGAIIFVHELGHFLAARWAGIRAPVFSVGFGPAVCSYRKGMGLRRGSTVPDYEKQLTDQGLSPHTGRLAGVSETEYRLGWLPLGGYVRMLGQEDANPNATDASPDSYTSKPVWKRMIVVSAGVVMNLVLAAILFVAVFLVGIREPPAIVGVVLPGSPAEQAGVRPGDRVLAAGDASTATMTDLMIAAAMAPPDEPVRLRVDRPGVGELDLPVRPEMDPQMGMLTIGVFQGRSATLRGVGDGRDVTPAALAEQFERAGLPGAGPEMTLVEVAGEPVEPRRAWRDAGVRTAEPLRRALEHSDGRPVPVAFRTPDGARVETVATPRPELQLETYARPDPAADRAPWATPHLVGLTPLTRVGGLSERGRATGLEVGDVLLRVGPASYPNLTDAVDAIRDAAGSSLDLTVLRAGERAEVSVPVSREGSIGFYPEPALSEPIVAGVLGRWTHDADPQTGAAPQQPTAAGRLVPAIPAGSRLLAVAEEPIDGFLDLRAALAAAARNAADNSEPVRIPLRILPPGAGPDDAETVTLALSPEEADAIARLGWTAAAVLQQFQLAEFEMRAAGPIDAMALGLAKTHRVMLLTYLTFKRLAQGTVSATTIRGPVGIAALGTLTAERGLVHLLFFLALISVNLAVINFLPLPIVDGGLFLMLVYEAVFRRPVPLAAQAIATYAGLVLIAGVFIFVLFNDVRFVFDLLT